MFQRSSTYVLSVDKGMKILVGGKHLNAAQSNTEDFFRIMQHTGSSKDWENEDSS